MNKYNALVEAVPMPARIRALPVSDKGFPVPWFVQEIDGKPDFRVADTRKMYVGFTQRRCWICGQHLGRNGALLVGPMCVINRVSAEPPSHRDCAEFAVRACPFLVNPRSRRNDKGLPEEVMVNNGMVLGNPGVMALWVTRAWDVMRTGKDGVLFTFEDPTEVTWWTEGRPATGMEALNALRMGAMRLAEVAAENGEGEQGMKILQTNIAQALSYIPEA